MLRRRTDSNGHANPQMLLSPPGCDPALRTTPTPTFIGAVTGLQSANRLSDRPSERPRRSPNTPHAPKQRVSSQTSGACWVKPWNRDTHSIAAPARRSRTILARRARKIFRSAPALAVSELITLSSRRGLYSAHKSRKHMYLQRFNLRASFLLYTRSQRWAAITHVHGFACGHFCPANTNTKTTSYGSGGSP